MFCCLLASNFSVLEGFMKDKGKVKIKCEVEEKFCVNKKENLKNAVCICIQPI